jgi:type I restriction enzyme S subunit
MSPKEILGQDAPSRARKVIRTGDIIFATTRPYLKNIAMVPPDLDEQICSTGFCVIRANREFAEPEFLFHLCRSDFLIDQLTAGKMRGASYPAVTDNDVYNILIPLPPLEEQRRIVAKVEALMARIHEARRLRAEARKDTEHLMQAALAELFPCPEVALPKGWRWVRLGEVCETKMGGTPSTKTREFWEPPEIVWITPEDLEKSELKRVFSSRRMISRAGLENSNAKLFPSNTVLLSTTATIGKVGIAGKPLSSNQQISGIICQDVIVPDFLGYYLLKLGEAGLKKLGGTATATHINQANLRSLLIPLPPLDEQRRIVAYLDQVQQQVTALKQAQAEAEAELKRLEQAILVRAFKGEL